MSEISIFLGLGNPGERYRRTRHNLGKMVLDRLAEIYGLEWRDCGAASFETRWEFGGRKFVLLESKTYMNSSGAVFSSRDSIDPSSLLVIFDDINIPLGRVRIRAGGGSGGHRGVDSVISGLGSSDFARFRIGIGPPPDISDYSDYVLAPFREDEAPLVERIIDESVEALKVLGSDGLQQAMQSYNGLEIFSGRQIDPNGEL